MKTEVDAAKQKIMAILKDGSWYHEQDLVHRLAAREGISEAVAFGAVIHVWHMMESHIERRFDREAMDFEWRLRA